MSCVDLGEIIVFTQNALHVVCWLVSGGSASRDSHQAFCLSRAAEQRVYCFRQS